MERLKRAQELCRGAGLTDEMFIENMVMVYLGVRSLSLVSLPAELPGGDIIGRKIDIMYRESLRKIEERTSLSKVGLAIRTMGMSSIQRKRFLLRQAYHETLRETHAYRSLFEAAAALDMSYLPFEVRPSIQEVYFCRAQDSREQLLRLVQSRVMIRQEAWARATADTPYWLLAYPEEHEPDFMRRLGKLLGYPDCCVSSYVKERLSGKNVERRAARQLTLATKEGGFSPWAFFVKHFFPCRPDCAAAVRQGETARVALGMVCSGLAEEYARTRYARIGQVLVGPDEVADHLRNLQQLEPPAASPE